MLKPRKKLTRKEIKEDPLVTYYVQFQKLLRKYNQQINIGLIAIVVIIAGGIVLSRSQKGAERKAASQLAMAEQPFYAQQYDRAILELAPIVDTFSGTKAGARAAFFLATAYFEQNDYDKALTNFEICEKKSSKNLLLKASSMAGMAACLESLGRIDEAAQMYEKAGKKYGNHFSASQNLLQAARCYSAINNDTKALELYNLISSEYPESNEAKDVDFLKAAL